MNQCQYDVVDSQSFCFTLFVLKMAKVEGQNVCSMFLTSFLAVIFEIKLPIFPNFEGHSKNMQNFSIFY